MSIGALGMKWTSVKPLETGSVAAKNTGEGEPAWTCSFQQQRTTMVMKKRVISIDAC